MAIWTRQRLCVITMGATESRVCMRYVIYNFSSIYFAIRSGIAKQYCNRSNPDFGVTSSQIRAGWTNSLSHLIMLQKNIISNPVRVQRHATEYTQMKRNEVESIISLETNAMVFHAWPETRLKQAKTVLQGAF